ncbi:hypothetical protein [Nitriliruptor alkaliphilus]|uniref:hypothetical protein n=1 Tax=Nitriliruptor alkaliphilus TaxID=427918 RepID=UPI00069722C5|nr:hypothetical protein [Nitriliruptor alkaliphilus]
MTSITTPSSAPVRPADRTVWHRPVLTLDAVGCAAIGAGLLLAPTALVDGFGLATPTPLRLIGVAFLVAAAANGVAARAAGPGATHLAIALDVGFIGLLVGLLPATAGDAMGWARLSMVAGIVVCVGFAAAKYVGQHRAAADRPGR